MLTRNTQHIPILHVQEYFKNTYVELSPHPLYLPDLAPCDFLAFSDPREASLWLSIRIEPRDNEQSPQILLVFFRLNSKTQSR